MRIWGSWTDSGRASACRLLAGGVVLAAVAMLLPCAQGDRHGVARAAGDAAGADKVAAFMRAKLEHSKDVLEGLSLADYDLIVRGAQQLSLASQESNWRVLQTEDYARQSVEFRRSCDSLRVAAEAKNLDAAVLAWMEVTIKCVQCHRYVRDEGARR